PPLSHSGGYWPQTSSVFEGSYAEPGALLWGPGERERAMSIEPALTEWDESEFWGEGAYSRKLPGLSAAESVLGQLARNASLHPGTVERELRDFPGHARALVPVRGVLAARLIARWLGRVDTASWHAYDWLDRHGEAAVELLIPLVFGFNKYTKHHCMAALRYLARRIGEAPLMRCAERRGPKVAAGMRSLLDTDPLRPLVVRPVSSGWLDHDRLPPVLLRDRSAVLGPEAVAHLVAALSAWSLRVPYTAVETIALTCDGDSLTRFSHALFELWIEADTPEHGTWALEQLACFGTDATVDLLEPHLRKWMARNPGDRAVFALHVLERLGHRPAAFGALHRRHRAHRGTATGRLAGELAEAVAARDGWSAERLADRLVPDLGLRDPETLVFDYGPRRFHLDFDDTFAPFVTGGDGRRRRGLPRPGARDDPERAQAAAKRYRTLTAQAASVAAEQSRRLEEAMLGGRAWTLGDFRTLLLEHPVLAPQAVRLVWQTDDGEHRTGFRIAEDGGFTDVRERPLEPPETAVIRLAHPATLGDEHSGWVEIFTDYAILQPFDQLSRPAMAFTAEEAETGRLRRFEGATATMGSLRKLMEWKRLGRPAPRGTVPVRRFERALPGGHLLAEIDPGSDAAAPDPSERHRITSLWLSTTRNRRPGAAKPLRGDRLDPITASELLAGFAEATGDR
ncbi:MAG TPA: DUF4132 domain-containing protein, partial [Glycomyces sp.]|nr:DUF4132 domain-containing protein [Glycomyces sp.]